MEIGTKKSAHPLPREGVQIVHFSLSRAVCDTGTTPITSATERRDCVANHAL